jgi:hypothetical protein
MKFAPIIICLTLTLFSLSQEEKYPVVDRINIGMTLDEVKEQYPVAKIDSVEAWYYGIDGGGHGYEVVLNDSVLFFFWLHWERNDVTGIVVISEQIEMEDGAHVGMIFTEFLNKYPNAKTHVGLLTSREAYEVKTLGYTVQLGLNRENYVAKYEWDEAEPTFLHYVNTSGKIERIVIIRCC